MNQSIFKAYDIRGVYPDEINKEDAYKIGFATAKFLQAKDPGKKIRVVVGEDCRIASPTLRGALIDALTRAGADVSYIGLSTTPLFYFSVNRAKADGGVMVTASHNPPQYGGLKIVGREARPIGFETGLRDIASLAEGNFDRADEFGKVEEVSYLNDYVDFVVKESGIKKDGKMKVVLDAGNGMSPLVLNPLMNKLGISYVPLYFEIDCNFPNHSPDISRAEALASLKQRVLEERANLGVAFDGDGDRVFFVDELGNIIRPDFILALLYQNAGGFLFRPKTVYDLRFSRSIKEIFGSRGIKSKVGRSYIGGLMRDKNADLGGEFSGHFFFKETKYVESSVLAMLKVLKIMSGSKKLSEITEPFEKYYHSGEINIPVGSREEGLKIAQKLEEKYQDGKIEKLDGVTVEYKDWWFNVRLSNTEPIIRLVIEAVSDNMLNEKISEVTKAIKNPFSH